MLCNALPEAVTFLTDKPVRYNSRLLNLTVLRMEELPLHRQKNFIFNSGLVGINTSVYRAALAYRVKRRERKNCLGEGLISPRGVF